MIKHAKSNSAYTRHLQTNYYSLEWVCLGMNYYFHTLINLVLYTVDDHDEVKKGLLRRLFKHFKTHPFSLLKGCALFYRHLL